jgi:hypothetical protein
MTAWPGILPSAPLAQHFREDAASALLRTEMDQGPAKLRRRTTAGVAVLEVAYLLSRAQVAALDAFYAGALSGGMLAFSYTHPRTGATVQCRFRAPPVYAATNGDYFHAVFALEVLP